MAAPVPKGPCRFFRSKDGCKYRNCKFLHDPTSGWRAPSRLHQNTSSSSTAATHRHQFGRSTPKNICELYWNTGSCKRGFDCTFKHEQSSNPGINTTGSEEDNEDAPNAALDFFTMDNLTHMAVELHSTQEGTPEKAHNSIKKYLAGGSLNKPGDMRNFVSILASVNRRNHSWSVDKAQEFLGMLIRSDKGLGCIGDILKFPHVSPKAGLGFTFLSFQLGYFPLLEYFTSDLVLKSTLHHNINALYAVLYEHWANVSVSIESSMKDMIANRTWNDPTPGLPERLQGKLTGMVVFRTISDLVIQIFNRFKTALERYPQLNDLVGHLTTWFDIWANGVQSTTPTFQDPVASTSNRETCTLTIQTLKETLERVRAIVGREHNATESKRVVRKKPGLSEAEKTRALLMQLEQAYEPASDFPSDKPRHDNDFADIAQIRICPTSDELMCPIPPYLPVTIPGTPHHLPAGSMERHLDTHFRLLREDLTFPIRESLAVLQRDLDVMWSQSHKKRPEMTELKRVLLNEGGLYRSSGKNSVIFTVYTDVHYAHLSTRSQGIELGLRIRCPPGPGRDPDPKKRVEYWKYAGSKKLSSGSLVALVIASRGTFRVYLANLVSSPDDISESVRRSERYVEIKASFFDPEAEIEALRKEKITIDANSFAMLIDNGVMFESVRPFLKTLSTIDSTSIPFSRYICAQDRLDNVEIRPPKYATVPGFRFRLQSVAKPGQTIHPLDINNPASVALARAQLRHFSVLDPSQADSVVDSLTREVSLIQGPPGTGKSYTGKELLRILFDNRIKPIVLIAFTNHALDHMLRSVLDAKITKKFVRLGSRSSDDQIAQYSLRNLEGKHDESIAHQIGREFGAKKKIEEKMLQVMDDIQIPEPSEDQIKAYLQRDWGKHLSNMYEPPFWITEYAAQHWKSEGEVGEWRVTGKKGKGKRQSHLMGRTYYGLWKRGLDIAFIQAPEPQFVEYSQSKKEKKMGAPPNVMVVPPTPKEQENYKERMFEFFSKLGFGDKIPSPPVGNQSVGQLLDSPAVWSMSLDERRRLAKHWEEEMRRLAYHDHLGEYRDLREEYEEACEQFEAVSDERKRRLLKGVDLIGCTTTGAAKLSSLLTSIQPRALVVEEGGQVLEAHILASLVDSVQHLICIGDPKQLRPNLATYSLSMDSERGKQLYKFDRSLMERLADNGFPMSQINVQRRMRPTISHHIRTILYPRLEDHEIVKMYPDVKGMRENVVFFTHDNKEDGGQDSASKVNTFEVNMIVDLVLYFLRQGVYNNQGDIAVLCAYLGQLQKVRAALRLLKVTVAVDERDEAQLVKKGLQDDDETPLIEEVEVAKHVRLGTVDIFQGQEAKIVIVSLVRNSGEFETDNASIGFLKSENRINVALSRAKHGLYVLGNASNLRKNSTWSIILDEMEEKGQIGFGFPVVCARHPEQVKIISEPGQLPKVAPLGGCLLPCDFKLSCGHNCQSTCHADLDNHQRTLCNEACPRVACIRQHPCVRRCHQPCGHCEFPISNVTLPCGHIEKEVPCHLLENLKVVKCHKMVLKKLLYCEHSKQVACFKDPASAVCDELCNQPMGCCSTNCKGSCGDCQKRNLDVNKVRSGLIKRINHPEHPCRRALYCQHLCGLPCHPMDQGCNGDCQQRCRQHCIHRECPKKCSVLCSPCLEVCPWKCAHFECPVACGSICARLPCDEPCTTALQCGHACPSVCGEPCAIQKCVVCMDSKSKTVIVDFIMQRAVSDLDTSSNDVTEKLIALECGHIFTVKTLDGHCSMSEYYETDSMTGRYFKMKAAPIKYQLPPTCPTCRGPLTSPRYGRVTKRANLDILEQNVARNLSKRLEIHGPSLNAIVDKLQSSETAAKAIAKGNDFASQVGFTQICERRKKSFGKPDEPLPVYLLRELRVHHGFSKQEADSWKGIVREINLMYEEISRVASTRSAHAKAYEAAMITLLKLEKEAVALNPSKVDGKTRDESAFQAVNAKIGQPPHRADRKYHVEAFLLSIELRLMLAQIASVRVSELPLTPDKPDHIRHREIWITFVGFLYDSCIKDCAKAISLARSSSAIRQEARVSLVDLRCTFEKVRFEVLEERRKIQTSRGEDAVGEMTGLGREVTRHKDAALESLMLIKTRYFRNRLIISQDENLWFKENCTLRAEKIFVAYENLREVVLKAEVLYQSMTLQEKQDIVKPFNLRLADHLYNCENGHPFFITECGAMQASTCPECRAPVGGISGTP